MEHHSRRYDDAGIGRIVKISPLIMSLIAIGGVLIAYGVMKNQVEASSLLSKETAAEVVQLKSEQAVQRQILVDVRESQAEARRDIKEILRLIK